MSSYSSVKNAKKLLATAMGEPDMCDEDRVSYYTEVFPSAIPIVYNHNSDNPLETRINELYGDTFFFIYRPLGLMSFMREKENEQPFYLFLVRNEYTFEKYVDFFFLNGRDRIQSIRRDKIKCFGCTRLLMLNEDKDGLYARYRNAVALAFKDGKNPVAKDRRAKSFLYMNDKLVETPGFFELDDKIEKEFEQNERDQQT